MDNKDSTRISADEHLAYARRLLDSIRKKADQNKRQSTFLFFVVLGATAFSPILILTPTPDWASKIIPAVLTAAAAMASGWLQLRKPQERWAVYRTAQREIEFEIDQYQFGNGQYADASTNGKRLTDLVSKRALRLHYDWLPIVPSAEDVKNVAANGDSHESVGKARD